MRLLEMLVNKCGFARRKPATPPLLFLHIPKTAGSSVNSFLAKQVPAGQFFYIDQAATCDKTNWLPPSPVRCYGGHVGYGFTRRLPEKVVVFTILRDPIERALSSYYYHRRLPRTYLEQVAPIMASTHELTFPEFIRRHPDVARAAFGNIQTAILSWSDAPFRKESVWAADLDLARRNLAKCLVGLTERLNDSLACLCHEFGWPMKQVPMENRTTDRPKAVKLDAETRAWLDEHTSLDAELYRLGQQLFQDWFDKLNKKAA